MSNKTETKMTATGKIISDLKINLAWFVIGWLAGRKWTPQRSLLVDRLLMGIEEEGFK